jgi:uncharacterized membrane protein
MPLSPEAEGASVAIDALPEDEKRVVVTQILEANPDWIPKGDQAKERLWMILLVGLFAVALVALVCAVVLVLNQADSGGAFVVVGAVVAGAVGLFSKNPAEK